MKKIEGVGGGKGVVAGFNFPSSPCPFGSEKIAARKSDVHLIFFFLFFSCSFFAMFFFFPPIACFHPFLLILFFSGFLTLSHSKWCSKQLYNKIIYNSS